MTSQTNVTAFYFSMLLLGSYIPLYFITSYYLKNIVKSLTEIIFFNFVLYDTSETGKNQCILQKLKKKQNLHFFNPFFSF